LQGVDAIAGVPGQDAAFLGLGAVGTTVTPGPEAAVVRVSIEPGPAFSNETQIGAGAITKPGPLAYCPASGSATSIQDVLLVISTDWLGGALYRVTGATTSSPTVTKVLDLPGTGQGNGLAALKADCGSGTVWAASSAPGAGLLESGDGGQTFSPVRVDDPDGGQEEIRAIAVTPGDPQSILVGDADGYIQSSSNGGQTWTLVNDPATDVNLSATANLTGGIWDLVHRALSSLYL
jgi:hypothetical protein